MATRTWNGPTRIIELAGIVVSAYVSKNSIPPSELPKLIDRVYAALDGIMRPEPANGHAEPEESATPEQIRASITPDALISFIDGKPYKTLKRHLAGHGLDPFSYRKRYSLPANYPMVALNYALRRAEIARGLTPGGHSNQQ